MYSVLPQIWIALEATMTSPVRVYITCSCFVLTGGCEKK